MKIGVLALQGDFREHINSLNDCGVNAVPVKTKEEIQGIDGLVIPGGESTTIAKLARSFDLFDLIKKRISDGMPTYGSCAGMILLADRIEDAIAGQESFGGIDMTVRRNAFGRQVDSFETDLNFEGITQPSVKAIFIRAPWVEQVGPNVQVLAEVTNADGSKRPVAVRQGNLLATSFHPELAGDNRIHRFFVEQLCANLVKGRQMSGHSKWATTKHKKAIIDSRRAKNFAKLIKAIEVSARAGGADVSGNPTLFDAIAKAKKNSVPADNIDRAVKRGAGLETGGKEWETIMYEGYGAGGVALLIECLSDNRNRAASDVRVAVTRNGGNMADPGSVSYLFNRKGVVIVKKVAGKVTEDSLLEVVLDAGAEEVNDLGESFEIVSEPADLVAVRTALQNAGIDYESAETSFLPTMSIPLDAESAKKVFDLIEAIEELDDVQNVYGNFDVSDEVMASLNQEEFNARQAK